MSSEIEDLQSRIAFQEDLISELNNVVAAQDKKLAVLEKQIAIVYSKMENVVFEWEQRQESDEPPPHY